MDSSYRPDASEPIGFSHYSVMRSEAIDALRIIPDGIYVDCTAGGGGHSFEIASRLSEKGRLIAFDQDSDALQAAKKRLSPYLERVSLVHANFKDVGPLLQEMGIEKIHGALLDLGVSSYQLDHAERGFSYMQSAPLDMRMDRTQSLTAYDVVNGYEEKDLSRILRLYGEEKFAPQIARKIVSERQKANIETTGQLSDLIRAAIPAKARQGGHHPAKKSFQAIRIEVNRELDVIEPALRALTELLAVGGRLAVITFHSLEDRLTKQTFASFEGSCTCPPDFPVCVCGRKQIAKALKSVTPSEKELEENPRSRSARLRVLEKI